MPVRVGLKATIIKLRPTHFNKVLHDRLVEAWGNAVVAFLKETASHVAVDTGMSLAAMSEAAAVISSQLGVAAPSIPVTGKRGQRPGFIPPELPYRRGSPA